MDSDDDYYSHPWEFDNSYWAHLYRSIHIVVPRGLTDAQLEKVRDDFAYLFDEPDEVRIEWEGDDERMEMYYIERCAEFLRNSASREIDDIDRGVAEAGTHYYTIIDGIPVYVDSVSEYIDWDD